MKTFETEKHNIPDGATHYLEATDSLKFAWWDSKENVLLCPENSNEWQPALVTDEIYNPTPIPQTNIETPEEKEAFDSMESVVSKEVEWVNGESLEYKNEDDEWESDGRYVCFDSFANHHVFYAANMTLYHADDNQIRKPETPQQREERERLEWIEKFAHKVKHVGTMNYKDILGEMYDSLK